MGRLKLTLACWDYDRTQALREGRVTVEGVDLNYIVARPEEGFWRMLKHREFDASEISLSNYIMLVARGESPFIAIPVFPSRSFRHNNIYINTNSGIKSPQDLAGKRVGAPNYHMTALLWLKGMLQDDYGVAPETINWVLAGLDAPGYEDRMNWTPPENLSVTIRTDRTLSEMLADGEIDALLSARSPSCFRAGVPNVARLFPNPMQVEMDYYRRTGFFPIMHAVAIRKDVYEANPWVARNLTMAFQRAKELAMERLWEDAALAVSLPWLVSAAEQHFEVFGHEWWPYGVEANRKTLEAMTRYSFEQGLSPRKVEVDELFAPSTLQDYFQLTNATPTLRPSA